MIEFAKPAERIMVALDVDELAEAQELIISLADTGVTFKVGNQLGTYEGWGKLVDMIHRHGGKVFCDTKFKDIPNTVEKSARAVTRHQPDFFNIMADNTQEALRGAVAGAESAAADFGVELPMILGVTVLTSMSEADAQAIYGAGVQTKVLQFAEACAKAGIPGLVCSAQEATALRANKLTADLVLVTPGIRPEWAASGDQSRILTPKQAVAAGCDYLVIGRPITQPPPEVGTSLRALELIIQELS